MSIEKHKTFKSEITLGNLLHIVAITGSALGLWMKINQDVEVMRVRVANLEIWQAETAHLMSSMERNLVMLTTLQKIRDERKD